MNTFQSIELYIPVRDALIPATLVMPEVSAPCPLVAFAHGFSGTRHEGGGYRFMADALAMCGIASVRMDFPGCGDSAESFRLCTLSNMVSDVQCVAKYVVERFPIDMSRIGIVGMSLGGRVAMELLNGGAPAFQAAVLIAPAADTETIRGVIGDAAAWENARQTSERDGYASIPCYFGGPDLEVSPQWFYNLEQMDTLRCASPGDFTVLVIYAEDDAIVPPDTSKRCAKAYGAELVEISGDGHSYGCYSDRDDILTRVAVAVVSFMQAHL